MIPIVNETHRYVYLFNPKAGCSSLRKVFFEFHRSELASADLARLNDYHNLHLVFPYSWTAHRGFRKYTVVRNPYRRVVSAFYNRFLYNEHAPTQPFVDRYERGYGEKTFADFVRYLSRWAWTDIHFAPQARREWLYRPYEIVKLERLADDLPRVWSRIFDIAGQQRIAEIWRGAELLNRGRPRKHYQGRDFSTAGRAEFDELAQFPDAANLITDELRARLHQIYRRDFKLFGYHPDDI